MPADVRDRRERRAADSATDRAVSALLAQPSAKSTTTMLLVAAAAMFGSWLAALVVIFARYFSETLTNTQVAALLTLPTAVVCGVACVAIAVVSDRRALHIVTLALGAVAPEARAESGRAAAAAVPSRPVPASSAARIAARTTSSG